MVPGSGADRMFLQWLRTNPDLAQASESAGSQNTT